MSDISFKPGGSGTGASLPFVSIDIPADATRPTTAATNPADTSTNVAARVVSIDVPAVTAVPGAGPSARGSGGDTPLPFVSIDIPADVG